MKKYLLVAFLLLVAIPASAVRFAQDDKTYSIPAGTTLSEDLYAAGDTVLIAGQVAGDVHIAGNTVETSGIVTESLFAAGRTVTIGGTAGQDVHAAAQTIIVKGMVQGDVVAAGETLLIAEGAVVDGNVLFFGGQLVIEGEVKGEVHVWGNEISLTNAQTGSVSAYTESVSLVNSTVTGDLTYTSKKEASVDSASVVTGKIDKKDPVMTAAAPLVRWSPFDIGTLLMAIAATAVALALFPRAVSIAVMDAVARPTKSILLGIAGLILTPIVAVVLLFTVVGMPLGFLVLFVYGAAIIIAKILSGVFAGALIAQLVKKEYKVSYLWAGAGIVALTLFPLIPYIGWIPGSIAFLIMFGILIRSLEKATFSGRSEVNEPTI